MVSRVRVGVGVRVSLLLLTYLLTAHLERKEEAAAQRDGHHRIGDHVVAGLLLGALGAPHAAVAAREAVVVVDGLERLVSE